MHSWADWEEIPEENLIRELDEEGEPHLKMNFMKILDAGKEYKHAGLTPIYVWDEVTHRLAVYAEELYGKKLH